MKSINELEINETLQIEGSGYFTEVLRVPGGYIYSGQLRTIHVPVSETTIIPRNTPVPEKEIVPVEKKPKGRKTTKGAATIKEEVPAEPSGNELPVAPGIHNDDAEQTPSGGEPTPESIPEPTPEPEQATDANEPEQKGNANDYDSW
jgi:hypothetical protein